MVDESRKVKYNKDLISEELYRLVEIYSFRKDKLSELRSEHNLNNEQFHEALKLRFRIVYRFYPNQIGYSSKLREIAKRYYPGWCSDFGIEPDPAFRVDDQS